MSCELTLPLLSVTLVNIWNIIIRGDLCQNSIIREEEVDFSESAQFVLEKTDLLISVRN